jgi:hypothetical protein
MGEFPDRFVTVVVASPHFMGLKYAASRVEFEGMNCKAVQHVHH